jgi:uncharacterized cupin superfamily protein
MAELQARVVAFVERHPKYFPDAITAVGELIRVLGDVDPFLVVDADGQWLEACAEIDPNFRPTRWIARRILPTGEYRTGQAEGMRAEQLIRRDDGRPTVLVATEECPTGENEDEPGGESFGYTTLIGRTAGLRRIGVNLDVVRPGQRSVRYHWHRDEEEGFLVLGGSGWLDVGGERYRVVAGDFFAKPEGPRYAHQFVNDGESDLRILSVGERRPDDVVEYAEAPWEPERPDDPSTR